MLLKILCLTLVFFSLAQPGLLFPDLGEDRIFFGIVAVTGILYFLQGRKQGERRGIPQSKYIYGMVVAYTLSEAQYFWWGGTISVFLFWFKKVFLYYLIVHILNDPKDVRKLIWCILLGIGVLTFLGWNEYLTGPGIPIFSGRLYSEGNYNNPNSFALALTLSLPLAFSLMEVETNILKKTIIFLFLILLVVSCAYTKSRGGMIGMMIALVMSILLSGKLVGSKGSKAILVGGTLLLFVGYGIEFVLSRPDIESFTGAGGEASAGDRLMAWIAGIKMFLDHPIFGIGWGKFLENAFDYGMDKRIIAHNTTISILAETGLVGIFFFGGILFNSFRELWRIRINLGLQKNKNELLVLTTGIFISLICFVINTSFSVKDHDPMYWNLLALTGVVYMVYMRGQKRESRTDFKRTVKE